MLYKTIIDCDAVSAKLDRPNWRIIDCRFSLTDPRKGKRDYEVGHIPGAVYADLDRDSSGPVTPTSGRHPLPDKTAFNAKLADWGIRPDIDVVVYDDANGAIAGRLWWMLSRWAGHPATAMLDGGFTRWRQLGLPVEAGTVASPPTVPEFTWNFDDSAWISTNELQQSMKSRSTFLIDARTSERYRGESEPIDPKAGHIPGATNIPLGDNLKADGRFKPIKELHDRFSGVIGFRSPSTVVHSCGSGVSACHNLLAMEIAGLTGSRLYVGSWSEWIRDPQRPIATGSD